MSLDQQGGIPRHEKSGGDDESWRALDLEAQLRFLAWASEELSASLAWTAALTNVARRAVGELADICAIEVIGDGDPQQLAVAHIDASREPDVREVLAHGIHNGASADDGPRRVALNTGEPVLLTEIPADYWSRVSFDEAHENLARSLGVHSLITVPMLARGRFTGVLTLAAVAPDRRFGAAHVAVARDLAGRVGLAIDNARLVGDLDRRRLGDQEARRSAERTAEQLSRLQRITARLARAGTEMEVADIVVTEGPAGVLATTASVSLIDESGEYLDLVREGGYDPGVVEQFRRFHVEDPLPAPDAVRTRRPVLLGSLAERDERYPVVAGATTTNHSFAVMPMVVDDRILGALAFSWAEDREFDADDVRFMMAVADQAAQALDRARLLEVERREAVRTAFLAEASRVLAGSLEADQTLTLLVQLIVPHMADAAAVHLGDQRALRLVAAANVDSARTGVTVDLGIAAVADRASILHEVLASGESRLVEEVTPALLRGIALDQGYVDQLRAVDVRSVAVLPLVARDRVIGVLTLTFGPSGRRFGRRDLPMIEDLANRAAAAIDNAWTHRAQREVATTLQRSLLPPELPAVDGLDLAARYHPVGDGSRVGGDFYDVFAAGRRRWAIVLGDVCGQGVAAAAFTAMVRWTARLAASEHNSPSDVLRTVNTAVLTADTGERFCTIVLAFVEPSIGGGAARVTLASGGHPLPVRRSGATGEVGPVGRPGTAIGLFPDETLEVHDVELVLDRGDALVFFTDGVTEARAADGRFRSDILDSVLRAIHPAASAGDIARAVDEEVLAFEGGEARDDVALLALVVPGEHGRPGTGQSA